MKKIISIFLSIMLLITTITSVGDFHTFAQNREPVINYTFENATHMPMLFGDAKTVYDSERKSCVLELNGTNNTYAMLPTGFFDNMDTVTISMDIKSQTDVGNFFTFAIGKDSTSYNYFRIRGTEIRNAITVGSYMNEHDVKTQMNVFGTWINVTIVIDGTKAQLYVNGELKDEDKNTGIKISDLGTELYSYIGKSLYDGDAYYKGCFDNFRVYDYALSGDEIYELANTTSNQMVMLYNFEDSTIKPELFGNARVEYDSERKSKVLVLDGSNNTYAKLPTGFFDNMDKMTISMDVKPQTDGGNFFTFAIGQNSNSYNFLRIRGSEIRNAITVNSYMSEREVKTSCAKTDKWMNLTIVYDDSRISLYVNGCIKSINENTGLKISDLGTNLISYIGKSMYDGDAYYKGCFDNFAIYNYAMNDSEIKSVFNESSALYPLLSDVTVGTVENNASALTGTDEHTAVSTKIDNGEITSVIRRGTVNSVNVTFSVINDDAKIYVDNKEFINGNRLNLSRDRNVLIVLNNRKEKYVLKTPTVANNSILPGQYADPDIDYINGKYWIFPTTDGVEGWGGTQFHAWSSIDLANWNDEGVILDVADDNPKLNDKDVRIASSPWSDGNAWAPAIEEKNGKYYFYYCARIKSEYLDPYAVKNSDGNYNDKAIGVAVADNPAGPYTALEAPIVYPKMMSQNLSSFSGQVIDPSVFTDDDGSSYLFFGNGNAAFVKLNSDMTSVSPSGLKKVEGMTDFRESVVVFKRNNIYYFTWSCDDTGSENYHVKYGIATSLSTSSKLNVSYKGILLQKDTSSDILGTGHQSTLYLPEVDRLFIVYHRFYTPLGIFGSSGCHRETCIDEVLFTSNDRLVQKTPTMDGVGDGICPNGHDLKVSKYVAPTCDTNGVKSVVCSSCGYTHTYTTDEIPYLAAYGHQCSVTESIVSCTDDGYIEYSCDLCNTSYKTDFVSAYGHNFEYVNATHFEYVCTNCEAHETKTSRELQNMWDIQYVNKPPNPTNIDDSSYFELFKDGIINAKDYAVLRR